MSGARQQMHAIRKYPQLRLIEMGQDAKRLSIWKSSPSANAWMLENF